MIENHLQKNQKEKKISVEQSLKQLEVYLQNLEQGEIGLDEAFEIFEEAVKLANHLRKKMESYERKIEIITNNSKEKGEFEAEDFMEE